MTLQEKIEKEFFNKLAEVLEKYFPKGECQERSAALVLNAMANVFLKEALASIAEEAKKEVKEELEKGIGLLHQRINEERITESKNGKQ